MVWDWLGSRTMVSWGPSWNLPLLLTVLHFTGPRSQEAVVPSPTATLVLFGISARAVLPGMASPPISNSGLHHISAKLWNLMDWSLNPLHIS